MKTLQNWKNDGKAGLGWPVNGITPDTGGLIGTDTVIYNETEGRWVYRKDKDGNISTWGIVTSSSEDKIEGTVNGKDWSFEITFADEGLSAKLFAPSPSPTLHFGGSHHRGHSSHDGHPPSRDGHDQDPTPGSWTAAEGGGVTPAIHREGERERERAA